MKNNKKTVILDFDGTINNASETIVELYQAKTKDYSMKYEDKLLQWDFLPYIPKSDYEYAISRFWNQELYDNMELQPHCKDTLIKHSENFEFIIVTKKNPMAVYMNDQWLRNMGIKKYISRVIYLDQKDFTKSIINADIHLDDKLECLLGGKRDFKLLFGDYKYIETDIANTDLRNEETILRIKDWYDFELFLDSLT